MQAKVFDREIFMKPQEDIRKPAFIWKLRKLLYGLDNTSRKFWLKVKETLLDLNLKVMDNDKVIYYRFEDGKLKGAVQTHVDDFQLAGTQDFINMIIDSISKKLMILKVE